MESDDDFELFSPTEEPSPLVNERRLKRLKKAIRAPTDPFPNPSDEGPLTPLVKSSTSETLDFEESNSQDSEELNEPSRSVAGSEGFDGENELDPGVDSVEENRSGAKRALEFDSVADEFDGEGEDRSEEMRDESGGMRIEESEKKRRSSDEFDEMKENKKKKRVQKVGNDGNKKITQKERKDQLKNLRAESQRLLRETRDATFKPVPVVHKPISSILEKIRQRKLEVSKKFVAMNSMSFIDDDDDDDDSFVREVIVDRTSESDPIDEKRGNDRVADVASDETITLPANMKSNLDESRSNACADNSSCERIPSRMDVDEDSKQVFRAPIDDTQELFSDSQTSESKDELPSEAPNSPLEEVLAPSILAMKLKLDSAPPDDVSSDEEDNDKENIDLQRHGLTDLSSSPNGDPVKAFVEDEAEEEDDSDNDLFRFQDDEEDEDNEDAEELNDMIATGYEEKPIDNEKRNQLHQKWLEQQDATGTENLLQKLNCGSILRETNLPEDVEDEEGEDTDDFGDEAAEDLVPTNVARMNLRKVKQMIPQMFTDKDDVYLSSDDEETEKWLAKRCLLEKSEEKTTFLSPAEDESSRKVFGLIKKLNVVPDTKKKAKTPSFFNMPLVGGKTNISSKTSFLGRGSNHSLPSSKKHGAVRSFIFGRDDSNSRNAVPMSEDSSDTIQRENRPTRPASAKFSNSQIKSSQNIKSVAENPEMNSGTSLFEILRRSTLQSEHCTRDNMVVQTESVFAAFKLAKKPIKREGRL